MTDLSFRRHILSKKTRKEYLLASFPEEQFLYKQNHHQFQSTGIRRLSGDRRTTHRKFREKHWPACNFSDWTVPELRSERLILLAGCCVWHGEPEQTDKPWHAAPRRESCPERKQSLALSNRQWENTPRRWMTNFITKTHYITRHFS